MENSSSSKILLQVYSDEFNDTTRIYVGNTLMYSSKYVRSLVMLDKLVQRYKVDNKEYEVIYHTYKYA